MKSTEKLLQEILAELKKIRQDMRRKDRIEGAKEYTTENSFGPTGKRSNGPPPYTPAPDRPVSPPPPPPTH